MAAVSPIRPARQTLASTRAHRSERYGGRTGASSPGLIILLEVCEQESRRLEAVNARRDIGDVTAVAFGQVERVELRPDLGRLQLVSYCHSDDVDQVRVVRGRGLSKGKQRPDFGHRRMPRTSAAARRPNGSLSLRRLTASSRNGLARSCRSTKTLRPCTRSSQSRSLAQPGASHRPKRAGGLQHPKPMDSLSGGAEDTMILWTAATAGSLPRSTSWLAAVIRTCRFGWPKSAIKSSTDDLVRSIAEGAGAGLPSVPR